MIHGWFCCSRLSLLVRGQACEDMNYFNFFIQSNAVYAIKENFQRLIWCQGDLIQWCFGKTEACGTC